MIRAKGAFSIFFIFQIILFQSSCGEIARGENDRAIYKSGVIIYFKPGGTELVENDLDRILSQLDLNVQYIIEGYSCKFDNFQNLESQMALAEKRAQKIINLLIKNGFSKSKISTTAYDHTSECKVKIVKVK
jgi:outer membrane protein OmpA-like peptidoglycan-associated protein